ncbi:hypothetical protein ACMU_06245 [Actibacterium mucosum KCTC 23349]|uniref:Hedgehog/Intein (Hint) domain-containing protein n=1 Tax=Actibacterium mucosum KCTC 23349 TaxID=1454373 RepID=A0A037ZKB0_9RHOB|nr:Hint domain-containing protein [Actibacterium mucosum]KAJ56538.1 hypothetical protein ACMU_06245 [Actibacterium mucosum KCTC 23349]
MANYFVQGYHIEDFSGRLGSNRTINKETTGSRLEGTSTTLSGDAETVGFSVTDDDAMFEDAFQETGDFSVLNSDLTLGDTTFPAGSHIELEFSLTTEEGITLWVARIGDGTSNSGQNQIILSSEPLTPGQTYTIADSQDGVDIPFSSICFVKGTRIATPDGYTLVQDLRPGDLVRTRDDGTQPVQWVGSRLLSLWHLARAPQLAPIRIRKGALGNGTPRRDLLVSPQHRMAINGWRAELLFGAPSVLVSAKALLNDTTITVERGTPSVAYFHILLPKHSLVLANGAWSETLLTGPEARATLSAEQLNELNALVPDWQSKAVQSALPTIRSADARLLVY